MTTRKYPRTLQEAFGPHTSTEISEPEPAMDWQDKVVLAAGLICAVSLVVMILI